MRTNEKGETHLGVVVRTNFAGIDSSATSQDYMNSIYLVSVNRSLRQVSLATWGNPVGGFGGFSLEPGKYHARRLLKKSETGELSAAAVKPEWELLDESKVKLRSYYPPETEVPRGVVKVEHENSDVTIVDQNKKIVENLVSGKVIVNSEIEKNHYYHRELPTTSFSYRTDQALLGTGSGDTLQKIPALVTQLSGWRNRGADNAANHSLSYHTGVDLSRWSTSIAPTNGENREVKILAPEDGLFYVWKSTNDPTRWHIPSELLLRNEQGTALSDALNEYSGLYYGLIGVLITRPDSPKDGRVYLFAHLGDKGNSYISNLPYNGEYSGSGEFSAFSEYPDPTHPQMVTAGTPLAYVGALGNDVPFHVHLEVYEHFSDTNDWLRVDPLSCFSNHLFGEVESGSQADAYPLYGWWARLLNDEDEYACKSLFQSESNAGILINSLGGGADYTRGWRELIEQYSMQHTWIYFREAIEQRIDAVNVEENKNLTIGDIFRSDRWDNLREINYAE